MGFSLKGRATDWLAGFVVAVVIIGGGTLLLMLLTYVKVEVFFIDYKTLALNGLLFLFVSISEEVVMRGYVLNNLLEVMNRYAALAISAVLFAGMHGLNPNLSWLAMLNLFLAGIILGATYIFTENLWFPISLHLFWNFIQGPVLGYNVSGQKTESVFNTTPIGNPIISGGEFGFEGSILCSVLIVLVCSAIFLYYEKKRKLILLRN
jgi:membrane protease YdiL (CAAX protease family)